ncbi:uncharacterized protein LOC132737963 [Ruditapes philippinarum]|uniref:uncharacterized protein LOC132737963 n=1 Tax=Ruditapes philippinarum TaxID=129788 RepID=UPI00295BF18E|nr:uncharacterized protein LOC132737963 [Ruditapes philippinarum]
MMIFILSRRMAQRKKLRRTITKRRKMTQKNPSPWLKKQTKLLQIKRLEEKIAKVIAAIELLYTCNHRISLKKLLCIFITLVSIVIIMANNYWITQLDIFGEFDRMNVSPKQRDKMPSKLFYTNRSED